MCTFQNPQSTAQLAGNFRVTDSILGKLKKPQYSCVICLNRSFVYQVSKIIKPSFINNEITVSHSIGELILVKQSKAKYL